MGMGYLKKAQTTKSEIRNDIQHQRWEIRNSQSFCKFSGLLLEKNLHILSWCPTGCAEVTRFYLLFKPTQSTEVSVVSCPKTGYPFQFDADTLPCDGATVHVASKMHRVDRGCWGWVSPQTT